MKWKMRRNTLALLLGPVGCGNWYLLKPSLYTIQHFHLRTSWQLRFLDIENKAPLYSQIMKTLSDLGDNQSIWMGERCREQELAHPVWLSKTKLPPVLPSAVAGAYHRRDHRADGVGLDLHAYHSPRAGGPRLHGCSWTIKGSHHLLGYPGNLDRCRGLYQEFCGQSPGGRRYHASAGEAK
jgi:hypothetical protein